MLNRSAKRSPFSFLSSLQFFSYIVYLRVSFYESLHHTLIKLGSFAFYNLFVRILFIPSLLVTSFAGQCIIHICDCYDPAFQT